jgi:hypothetical protein
MIAVMAPLALAACSPAPFNLEVTGPLERPVLELKRRPGILFSGALCIQMFTVARDRPGAWAPLAGDTDVAWRVEADGHRCAAAQRVAYGAAIPGLATVKAAEALQPGVRYAVFGQAAGGERGSAVILFEDGRWKLVPDRSVGTSGDAHGL